MTDNHEQWQSDLSSDYHRAEHELSELISKVRNGTSNNSDADEIERLTNFLKGSKS